MTIQWFPGHMAAARKKIAEAMANIDVVIEITDARAPEASRNPLLGELAQARQRPRLLLLNKADLADPGITEAWIDHLGRQPATAALALTAKDPSQPARLVSLAQRLAPHRCDASKPLRLMLAGIPNVGKSTLINALLKRRVAKVANEPAVTRAVARYDLSPRVVLFDTPGMLWPKIERIEAGLMLAAIGAIGQNAYHEEEVAEFLADFLLKHHPDRLRTRYGQSVEKFDSEALFEAIGRRRGCWRNEKFDREKAARILLDDFRAGALGRISLEMPVDGAGQ